MKLVFVESSAFLRVLFEETGYEAAAAAMASAHSLLASRLLRLEAERVVLRASQRSKNPLRVRSELGRELRAAWPRFDFVEMTAEICGQAGLIAPESSLRSLDAIHVATYYWLKERVPELKMLTFDKRIESLV